MERYRKSHARELDYESFYNVYNSKEGIIVWKNKKELDIMVLLVPFVVKIQTVLDAVTEDVKIRTDVKTFVVVKKKD